MSRYEIRPMGEEELHAMVDSAAAEGWNPGLHDAGPFYAQDPEGFLCGCLDGRPVAWISAVRYGDEFGFIGFYMVLPEYRHSGYGIPLSDAATARLKGIRVGIDGVFERQEDYHARYGYEFAYRNIRFELKRPENLQTGGNVEEAAAVPFAELAAFDRRHFPAPREAFLRPWLQMPDSHSLVVRDGGEILGYGTIRPCRQGWKIGPLFANNAGTGEDLFCALLARVPVGDPVYLDVPEPNEAGMAMAGRYGMQQVFGTARMYTGGIPDLPLDRIFGVTTFELG